MDQYRVVKDTAGTLREVPPTEAGTAVPPDQLAAAVVAHLAANPPKLPVVGTVTLGQTATVAITAGIRELTVPLTGAVKGRRYLAFCDSYRLNGGASVVGRPPGYALIDATCNSDGQITIAHSAPVLAIGAAYAMTCSVVLAG